MSKKVLERLYKILSIVVVEKFEINDNEMLKL